MSDCDVLGLSFLTFERGSGLETAVFADANYADKADVRRAVSGVAVTLGKSVVSRSSGTQGVATLSTAQAMYIATGDGVKEGFFVKSVSSFIVPSLSEKCVKVFADNDGVIALTTNLLSSVRTKHIDVRFHFIIQLARSKTICAEYVPTKEQREDILIKALVGADFKAHRNFLMNLHV